MELLCVQATAINFSVHCYVHKQHKLLKYKQYLGETGFGVYSYVGI